MKFRAKILAYIVTCFVVVAASVATLFPVATVQAAPKDDAKAYCTAQGYDPNSNASAYNSCFYGYVNEIKGGQDENTYCNHTPGLVASICINGWNAAKNHTQTGSGGSVLQTEIAQACAYTTGTDQYNSCAQGVTGESKKQTKDQACQGAKDQTACNNGWTAESYRQNPNQATAAAQQACASSKGGDATIYAACLVGAESGAAGDNTNAACDSYSGAAKAACQTAYAGAQPGGGDTTPTCQTSDNPLSWFLCPVFDLVSDAAHWIFQDVVQPFLVTAPISTDSSDPSYKIWSNFRVYGDIFLVFALLAIVFSETIGGGLIEAYTVKKVLPRLLIAAVLINLSIYIVAFLVDISNILGSGVSGLLTSPLQHCAPAAGSGNCWDFTLSGADGLRVFGVGLVGFLATSTAAAGFLGVFFSGGLASTVFGAKTALTAAFFVGLPVIFAVIGVFLTLIFRKGLILLLVLVSPVAFALYCLPNTERFFKRWWDLLIEALMVYPIVVAIFGVADLLSITILTANHISQSDLTSGVADNLGRTLALVTAFLLQFLPLLAIPFAFRFASGALRRVYDAATTAGAKVNDLTKTRTEQAKADYRAQSLAARGRLYHGMQDYGNQPGRTRVGRGLSRWAGRKAGGYNIEGLLSGERARVGKEIDDQIATGRDEEIRGLTVNKSWADSQGAVTGEGDNNGHVRIQNGQRQYRSLGGAWVNEQDVDAGHRRWGRNQLAQQAALNYEMRKGMTEEQLEYLQDNYHNVATGQGGWGMTSGEATGAWIGAAFANQNQHLEYKYTDAATGQLTNGGRGFVDEVYEKRGSYPMAQMSSHTIKRLQDAHAAAERAGDTDTQQKIAAIAETFMHQLGTQQGESDGQPIIDPATGQPQTVVDPQTGQRVPVRQVSTAGAGHVAERVHELADMTGVLRRGPTGTYGPDHLDNTPTTNHREQ